MKILIIGLNYFGNKLELKLKEFDKKNKYIYLDIYNKKIDKIKYLFHLLSSNVVYSIGGMISFNRLINIALFCGKKIIMHWVGSDVLQAKKALSNNLFIKDYIDKVVHFCEVGWIREELTEISIDSEIVQFACFENKMDNKITLSEKFRILTYFGAVKGYEDFYGFENIINLAHDFPEIEIIITGNCEVIENIPDNIKLVGWTDKIDEYYKDCIIFLRLTSHDGLSFSVLEALSNARYVGYNYKFNNCFEIKNYDMLKKIVKKLLEEFKNGTLKPNLEGRTFINENFNKKNVLEKLILKLTGI